MENHNKSDIVETYGWRLIMWEYYRTDGKYEKDPKEIGGFNQEFIGDTFNQLSNEDKKKHLRFMFDNFYEDICQQMGLN